MEADGDWRLHHRCQLEASGPELGRARRVTGGCRPFFGSESAAAARAAWASWGREVRMTEAERGRGRSMGWGESGMGVSRGGVAEVIVGVGGGGWGLVGWRSSVERGWGVGGLAVGEWKVWWSGGF